MAVGYGSSSRPIGLSTTRIGRLEKAKEEESALVDILLILGEIASLAIPGVGEFVSAGFATAQAAKTTVQQLETTNPNKWAIGLSIAGALVSAGSATSSLSRTLTGIRNIREYELAERIASGREALKIIPNPLQKPLEIGPTALTEVADRANIFEKLGKTFEKVGQEIGATERQTFTAFERYIEATRTATSTTSTATESGVDIEELERVLGKRDYALFKQLTKDIKGLSRFGMSAEVRRFFNSLSETKKIKLTRIAKRTTEFRTPSRYLSKAADIPSWRQYLTSSRFYNKEIQWMQNINGSDAGRWLAEQTAHYAKSKAMKIGENGRVGAKAWKELNAEQKKMYGNYKKFQATIKKTTAAYNSGTFKFKNGNLKGWYQHLLDRAAIYGRELMKREQKVEKLFAEAGGVVINSRYLLGYKVISTKGAGNMKRHYVQMSFRKWATRSASGKNKNGKSPVMIYATTKDLKRLATEGSTYWFQVGAKKGWFMSRGGRTVNVGSGVSPAISAILTFLPIQAIRSFGSIVSNIKAFSNLISESTSFNNFMQSWAGEFGKAFESTAINRVGRIGANQFIGRWAGFSAGRFVGKFAQQAITGSINSARLSMNSKTNLSWAHYMRQQAFGKNGFLSMRLQSEMKRGILKKTGRRVSGQTGHRKLQIAASARNWASW